MQYHQTQDWCEITTTNISVTLKNTTLGLRLCKSKIPSSVERSITIVQLTACHKAKDGKGKERCYVGDTNNHPNLNRSKSWQVVVAGLRILRSHKLFFGGDIFFDG